jgi:hypothetical protein
VDTTFATDCEQDGYATRLTYTWLATDICGNAASLSITVDIMDDVPPVFLAIPSDTSVICAPLPPVAEMTVLDSLEAITIVYNQTIASGPGPGQYTVIRTWTATDLCRNATTITQHILWQPESTLECNIILPEFVECNSHGVLISGEVTGGEGSYNYEWEIVGEKCFLQSGQGTPDITIYMGWADVKILLTVTDTFGCTTMCMVFLHCLEQSELPFTSSPVSVGSVTLSEFNAPVIQRGVVNTIASDLSQFTLWPNPAGEEVNVSFQSGHEGIIEYHFTNYLGKLMLRENASIQKGINTRTINISALPNGPYVLQFKSAGEIFTKGIVILRTD